MEREYWLIYISTDNFVNQHLITESLPFLIHLILIKITDFYISETLG